VRVLQLVNLCSHHARNNHGDSQFRRGCTAPPAALRSSRSNFWSIRPSMPASTQHTAWVQTQNIRTGWPGTPHRRPGSRPTAGVRSSAGLPGTMERMCEQCHAVKLCCLEAKGSQRAASALM